MNIARNMRNGPSSLGSLGANMSVHPGMLVPLICLCGDSSSLNPIVSSAVSENSVE